MEVENTNEDKAMTTATAEVKQKVQQEEDLSNVVSLDDEEVTTVKLFSSDDQAFEVDRKNASISTLVKTALEDNSDTLEIPVPGVKGEVLKHVVEYMNIHAGTEPKLIEKPLRSKVMAEVVKDPRDAPFIDAFTDRQSLYDLILGANYMDVKSLLHLACAKVASLIKGQPLEKIKTILDPLAKQEESVDDAKSS